MYNNENHNNKSLTVCNWNCNSISKKQHILEHFLRKNNIPICGLNETKLNEKSKTNFCNYYIFRRDKTSNRGGVAILARNDLECKEIESLKKYTAQIMGIKIKMKNNFLNFITIYIPPINNKNKAEVDKVLNELDSIFIELQMYKPFILSGDFNCHSKTWYCNGENRQGKILRELLDNHNVTLINNNDPTRHSYIKNSSIIDLMIISSDLNLKLNYFKVKNNDLLSDHQPITGNFNLELKNSNYAGDIITKRRINWELYTELMQNKFKTDHDHNYNSKLEELESRYKYLASTIHEASVEATITIKRKINAKTLPNYLQLIIKERKKNQNQFRKHGNLNIKTHINFLTNIIKGELKALKENMWLKFCKKTEDLQKNSKQYWDKIKLIGSLEYKKPKSANRIPKLIHDGTNYESDQEKADLFGKILKNVFKDPNKENFNEDHKLFINNFIHSNQENLFMANENDSNIDNQLSINELNKCLKDINAKSTPGHDNISYKHFILLPDIAKKELLLIANISWIHHQIPSEWKTAQVTMLRKKQIDLDNQAIIAQ